MYGSVDVPMYMFHGCQQSDLGSLQYLYQHHYFLITELIISTLNND